MKGKKHAISAIRILCDAALEYGVSLGKRSHDRERLEAEYLIHYRRVYRLLAGNEPRRAMPPVRSWQLPSVIRAEVIE